MQTINHKPVLDPTTHFIWNGQRLLEYEGGYVLINLLNDDNSCHKEYLDLLQKNIKKGKTLSHVIISDINDNGVKFLLLLIEKYPDITIILSNSLLVQLKKVIKIQGPNIISVKSKTELEIGKYKFEFIPAPFSVYPFNMFITITNLGVIFTGEFLASKYKFNDYNCHIYLEEKHKKQYNFFVAFLVDVISSYHEKYNVEMIIPLYEFELHYDEISVAINKFKDVNKMPKSAGGYTQIQNVPQRSLVDRNKALIIYNSFSSSTKHLAEEINKELNKKLPCNIVELTNDTIEDVYKSVPNYSIICIGSPTLNREPTSIISSFLSKLHYYDVFDTKGFAFGTYSWSYEAVEAIHSRMTELGIRCIDPLYNSFGQTLDVSSKVRELLDLDDESLIPKDEVGNFFTGHFYDSILRLYTCQVCSQEYRSVNMPHKCLNCGAHQDHISLGGELTEIVKVPEKKDIIIIGGGCAAFTAATNARKVAENANITIISNEHYLPYNRIQVTHTAFGKSPERLQLRDQTYYDKQRINILLDTTVTEIDSKSKIVHTDKGGDFSYSQLVVCTGAEPIKLFKKYKNLFYVRKIEDVSEMGKYITKGSRGAIIGGGVLGMEVLAELPTSNVDVIEKFTCLCKQAPWSLAKKYVRDAEKTGVKVFCETEVIDLITKEDDSNKSESLSESNKLVTHIKIKHKGEIEEIPTDWVVVAVGVRSTTMGLGERKIMINSACQTDVECIYACGDCSLLENGHYVETWNSATQTAAVAGYNAAVGKPTKVLPVGDASFMEFAAKMGDKTLISVGILHNKNDISVKLKGCEIYVESENDEADGAIFCACYGPTEKVGGMRSLMVNGVRQRTPRAILLERIIEVIG